MESFSSNVAEITIQRNVIVFRRGAIKLASNSCQVSCMRYLLVSPNLQKKKKNQQNDDFFAGKKKRFKIGPGVVVGRGRG